MDEKQLNNLIDELLESATFKGKALEFVKSTTKNKYVDPSKQKVAESLIKGSNILIESRRERLINFINQSI